MKNSFLGSRKVFTEFLAQVAADLITGSSPARLLPAGTERATVTECMVRRRTAREKCLEEESLRQCIRPFCGELFLLAMMRYAACCPQKPLGHVRAHSVNRFQARRSDCSFIFTRPMQTLVGELGSIFCYVCLCRCSAGSRFVILTT